MLYLLPILVFNVKYFVLFTYILKNTNTNYSYGRKVVPQPWLLADALAVHHCSGGHKIGGIFFFKILVCCQTGYQVG